MIEVYDSVLSEPKAYREKALAQPTGTVESFHGIAEPPDGSLVAWFTKRFPEYTPTLTFLRKSPQGQQEPNFVHTDEGMGDLTVILYLNPKPPSEDGTTFWTHLPTGKQEGSMCGDAGKKLRDWKAWRKVPAKFNRAVVFSASLFHSRAIEENYGNGNDARLIQVLFARVRG